MIMPSSFCPSSALTLRDGIFKLEHSKRPKSCQIARFFLPSSASLSSPVHPSSIETAEGLTKVNAAQCLTSRVKLEAN